jgi:hypothetical protein
LCLVQELEDSLQLVYFQITLQGIKSFFFKCGDLKLNHPCKGLQLLREITW